jgi:uncharacterized protein (TIGR03435 family)
VNTTARILVVSLIAWLAIARLSAAQKTDEAHPAFEMADVHVSPQKAAIIRLPSINSEMRGGFVRDDRYELHNATITDLIGNAYGVETDKVIGGPEWIDKDEFEVVAKAASGTTTASLRLMIQALLTDRFKLVVHRDTRTFLQYALTAGRHPQLNAAAGGESGCSAAGPTTNTTVSCRNMSMAEFARRLPGLTRCCQATPVADLTGLTGVWNFTFEWTAVSIFDAIDKQLGLKLAIQHVPMPVIVVDSVNEKPTRDSPGISESLPAIPTAFEVADIKPSAPDAAQRNFRTESGGRVQLRGFSLKELIKLAWEISDFDAIDNDDMLVGAPKDLDKQRFDIVAEVTADGSSIGQRRLDTDSARMLLRTLLADRFRLRSHLENRRVAAFAMVAAKPKLKRADASSRPGCRNAPAPPGSAPVFSLHCQNTTMAQLAEELPAFGGLYVTHPVFDATGLEGGWDFDLSWSPPHLVRGGEAGLPGVAADPNGAFTIVEALDKQLGLKLMPQKHPMPVLVIDHVDLNPTEN